MCQLRALKMLYGQIRLVPPGPLWVPSEPGWAVAGGRAVSGECQGLHVDDVIYGGGA